MSNAELQDTIQGIKAIGKRFKEGNYIPPDDMQEIGRELEASSYLLSKLEIVEGRI